jgi:acetolactate synthase-1/2/3 large subunit
MYGTIRAHQERHYPGRVIATRLENPDFVGLANACGAHGEAVRENAEFLPALERALGCGGPALLELHVDPETLFPDQTISAIRDAATATATATA